MDKTTPWMGKSALEQQKSEIFFEIESIRVNHEESREKRAYRKVSVGKRRFSTRLKAFAYYILSGGFQRNHSDQVCQLHEELRGGLGRMKMLGLMPLNCTSTEVQFKIISLEMLQAVLIYIFCMTLAIHTCYEFISSMMARTQTFEDFLLMQMFVFMLIPYISTPLTYWLDCANTAKYYNHWVAFQKRFLQVTGTSLQLGFQTTCDMLFVPNAIFGITPLVWWSYIPPYLDVKQCITYYLCCILCSTPMQIIWFYNHKALNVAAQGIEGCFQDVLSHKPSAQDIYEYKHLWLDLTELVREFGPSMHRSIMTFTLVVIWCVTSTLYGCLSCMVKGDWALMSMFAMWTTVAIIPYYFFCNTAHYTPTQVKEGIQKTLRMIKPTQFNSSVKDEIHAFLSVTMDPLAISLGGYFEVNRSLFHSTFATIVTYLIVLTQVDMSVKPAQS